MGKITIEFYSLQDGTEPVKDFLMSLDVKMRAKMLRSIAFLEANGADAREPVSKHLGDGIFELRAQFGNNVTRVLYFFFVGNKAILTNGFIKKTQKTPISEIDKAKRYRAEYASREDNNDQLR
ncbi:MAG: type II toxin-antitoxin system RelE/ParE family toxin [Oscillospiraceae bacterium]|nr:type II toxin-antitoxin system RelE/ParE family toxin [Oscillospiraceae bacterium]